MSPQSKPDKPTPLKPKLEAISPALRSTRSWVLWRYEWRIDTKGAGKWTKPPRQATGRAAKSNDRTTWSTFEAACAAAPKADGIGLVLVDDLVGVDLDHVLDRETGEVEPWANQVLQKFSGCYAERSPGGDGIRIFCRGKARRCGKGGPANRLEVYDRTSPRYLTVTGHRMGEGEVVEAQAALDWLDKRLMQKATQKRAEAPASASNTAGDDDVLRMAAKARNGAKFSRLWSGDAGADPSTADSALVGILSFWTQDFAQLDRLFRSSGLMRPKWDEKRGATTYGERTIATVLSKGGERYSGPQKPHSSGQAAGADEPKMSTPTPLPEGLPPVQSFDVELLPEALRDWVVDIVHRMQCPLDFAAVAAIVALSSLIGARAVMSPKKLDDWQVVPNLWGVAIGRPGVMKTPPVAEVLKAIVALEVVARTACEREHSMWEVDCKLAGMQTKVNERAAEKAVGAGDDERARNLLAAAELPCEPKPRRYIVTDATVEKLAEVLETNPWGLLVYRDELHGLLTGLDREGQQGSRGFYLTGYDGDKGHTVDRIERGTHYVQRVCFAMLGTMQPGKAESYVRAAVSGGASDDGLLQRFGMAVWPDVSEAFEYVDRAPSDEARLKAHAAFERLNELNPATEDRPQVWKFSDEAQAIFREWLVPFETELRGVELHPALVSHLTKYRKLVPALALICALVDTPDSDNVVHVGELLRALSWAEYLRTHAERLYAAAVTPEASGARLLLQKLQQRKLVDGDGNQVDAFTARQVAVKHWGGLTSVDEVRKAADLLVDYGWLFREVVTTPGARPSERYLLHPVLMEGAS